MTACTKTHAAVNRDVTVFNIRMLSLICPAQLGSVSTCCLPGILRIPGKLVNSGYRHRSEGRLMEFRYSWGYVDLRAFVGIGRTFDGSIRAGKASREQQPVDLKFRRPPFPQRRQIGDIVLEVRSLGQQQPVVVKLSLSIPRSNELQRIF